MVKINENEVIISKADLYILIGVAASVVADSYPKEYNFGLMGFAANIQNLIEQHIWGCERLPEQTMNMLQEIVPAEPEKKKDNTESYENMRSICQLLLAALQKTRAFHDLTDLKYYPCSGVLAKFGSHGSILINTEGDSGIAMIKDIVMHL